MYVACRSRLPRPRFGGPHRRPRISMASRLLDIAERHTGIQSGGNERMPQRVRRDVLGYPRPAGAVDEAAVVIGYLPDGAETREAGPAAGPSDKAEPHRKLRLAVTPGHNPQQPQSKPTTPEMLEIADYERQDCQTERGTIRTQIAALCAAIRFAHMWVGFVMRRALYRLGL
jgi:hypothetical protein